MTENAFTIFAKRMLEPHASRSLDDPADLAQVAATVGGITQTLVGLLAQTRAYLASGLDPNKYVEGTVATTVDMMIRDVVGESYSPPKQVLGRDNLREINPTGADWGLEALTDDVRAILHAAQNEERSQEEVYGFIWRGRTCLWTVPLKPIPLRELATSSSEVYLLVGRKIPNLPLFSVADASGAPNMMYEYSTNPAMVPSQEEETASTAPAG